jgi:hypothetical protein
MTLRQAQEPDAPGNQDVVLRGREIVMSVDRQATASAGAATGLPPASGST